MAYDNAVSALGKICQFHRDSIDSAQVYSSIPSFFLLRFDCMFITVLSSMENSIFSACFKS